MKYSFRAPTFSESEDTFLGDARIVFDLEKLIIDRLGCLPTYSHNDDLAEYDKANLIVGINESLDEFPTERCLRICISNDKFLGAMSFDECDILLQPDFNPLTPHLKNVASRAELFTIRALPTRCTSTLIKEAAKEYCYRKNLKLEKQPITALLVGNFRHIGPFGEHTPNGQFDSMASSVIDRLYAFFKKRDGGIFLTTSSRTASFDEKIILDRLQPWIIDSYTPSDNSKPNPYAAFLGLADEIMISGDSLSMMSDAVGTHKPVRLIHDKNLFHYSSAGQRPTDTNGECIDKVPFMVNGLIQAGAKELSSDYAIGLPPKFNTGLPEAVDYICETIRRKSSLLQLDNM